MRTKFLALILMVSGVTYACSDDDKSNYNWVDKETIAAFNSDFPNATHVEWEKKRDYLVVDFRLESGKREMEAWYDNIGTLYLTEKDMVKEELPTAVLTALQSSQYKDWRIDDIDEITREGYETVYVIEVEQGNSEVDLYYNVDGVLLKEVVDNAGGSNPGDLIPTALPNDIKDYLTQNYPTAKIVDIDKEINRWEVDIVDGKIKKELYFSLDGKTWLQTEWDVAISSIPEVVKAGIANSPYADWTIDDVDYVENPQGSFYKIEFEKKGEADVEKLFRTEDGAMVE